MLGLTYSLNASSDPSKPVPGNVTFTNMTQSFGVGIDTDSTEASQLAVHAVGHSLPVLYTSLLISVSTVRWG